MGEYFFFNGKIISAEEGVLKLNDLALLRGFGIFDFFRTHRNTPFLMQNYLERFFNSAEYLQIKIPFTKDYISDIVNILLKKNQIDEAGIRLVMTGGYTENGFLPGEPNFFILVEKINYPDQDKYAHGVKLYLHEHQRELSHIKTINYLTPISLRNRTSELKAYDVLYQNRGELLEVSRSNFFIVKNGIVITPDKNILPGITRKAVINLAKEFYEVQERFVGVEELWTADETFMTGTTKKVLPVSFVNDHIFNKGVPGPITQKLMQLFGRFEDEMAKK